MTLYNVFKTLHVISVLTWVGGGVLMQALAARARRAGPDRLFSFAQEAAWAGNKYFMPAAVATLLFGLATAFAKPYKWGFHPLWIKLGLLGFLITAVNGAGVLGRMAKKMAALAEEKGASDPAVLDQARKLLNAMRIDLVVILLVVVDMVFKPA